MDNLIASLTQPIQNCREYRWIWIFLISTSASLSGWMPGLTQDLSQIEVAPAAYAQDLQSKMGNYADAVLQMEPLRLQALKEVQEEMGLKTPKDVCRQKTNSLKVQRICTNFFNQSAKIIKQNGLSNAEFNQITEKVNTDPTYRQRLDDKLLEHKK